MDNKLFKETFSAVYAPEATVTEVLRMTEKKKAGGLGRGVVRAVLIAAIVLALAVSVYAATEITQAIRRQNRKPNHEALTAGDVQTDDEAYFTPTYPSGDSYEKRMHEVRLEVEMYPDAPETVDIFYMLQVSQEYTQIHGYLYHERISVNYSWSTPEGIIDFKQTAGADFDPSEVVDVVWTKPGVAPEVEVTWIAGLKGYLVREEPAQDSIGRTTFHWSDGDYLFRLQVPYEYTDAQLEKLISGIQPMENIRPYLIGMTAEEIEQAMK